MNKLSKISPAKPDAGNSGQSVEPEINVTSEDKSSVLFWFQQIKGQSVQYAEFEQLDNEALHKKSFDAEILAVAARVHLWMRRARQFQNN